jgi:hypothetical protein
MVLMERPLFVSVDPLISLVQGDTERDATTISEDLNMNKFMKQVAVAALIVTTVGAATTTQVQAGSDFGKVLLGVAAVGIVANHVSKNDDRHHKAAPIYSSRSIGKRQHRSHSRLSRHRARSHFGHGRAQRHSRSHRRVYGH